MTFRDEVPPTREDGIAYLLIKEEACLYGEFEWGKMVARDFAMRRSGVNRERELEGGAARGIFTYACG
jgi:hypothetical protein